MKQASKFQGLNRGMVIGCDMVAGVLVGGLIGWWLDRVTGWDPWCFLVFFVLGAAAGFRMVYAKMMKPTDQTGGERPAADTAAATPAGESESGQKKERH